ncbi:MAG: PKD domain-containing protein [Ignavibacteriales bacterium]|nr:PKD domain-containing protein [Ignavibacteriales bacterium]
MKKNILLIVGAILISFSSCKKSSDNPTGPEENSGKVTVGESIDLKTQSIGSTGGTIKVDKPGDKLNGMEIIVPTSAFTQTKNFKISYAEIKEHKFGPDFNPITPMIRIDYGGGYADSVMTLKLPATVPPGQFAMGFYYNEESGELEGIPVIAINDNEIVLATRHFSGNHLSNGKSLGKQLSSNGIMAPKTYVDIIAASMQTSKLFELQESGFRPGIDDWEFANYGSYIAPGGHCTGQSMTAMWYYNVHKLGMNEPSLYGRFETIPGDLWQDNPGGFRFASVVWKDQNPATRQAWLVNFNNIGTKRFSRDSLHYLAFAYAIHLTKQPQLTEIWNATGGHAMIVYKTNFRVLSIADPNFPSSYSRLISLGSDGKFIPYESKANANDPPTIYPEINYVAKSSLFSFEKIGQRWTEVENKTIGNDLFPAYQLKIKNDNDKELTDQMNTEKDTLKVYGNGPASACIGGTSYLWVQVFNDKGNKISVQADEFKGIPVIPLKAGLNKLGLYIQGRIGNDKWRFLDFKWFNIYYSSLRIDPNPIAGKPNEDVTITARTNGTAPQNAKYVWTFGDETSEVTKNNDSVVVHKFTKEGEFSVEVKLYDNSNNKLVGSATTTAKINNVNIIDILHKCTAADVTLYGDHLSSTGASFGMMMYMASNANLSTEIPVVWNGNTFTANGTFLDAIYQGAKSGSRTLQFTGTVSNDGRTMLSFSASVSASYAFYDLTTYTETEQLAGTNIQLDSFTQDPPFVLNSVIYKLKGSGVQSHMTVISGTKISKDKDGKITGESSYGSTLWNSTEYEPSIEVSFSDYW